MQEFILQNKFKPKYQTFQGQAHLKSLDRHYSDSYCNNAHQDGAVGWSRTLNMETESKKNRLFYPIQRLSSCLLFVFLFRDPPNSVFPYLLAARSLHCSSERFLKLPYASTLSRGNTSAGIPSAKRTVSVTLAVQSPRKVATPLINMSQSFPSPSCSF